MISKSNLLPKINLLAGFVFLFTILLFFGSQKIISYNFNQKKESPKRGNEIRNNPYLYDDSVIHEISINFKDGDYEQMLEKFKNNDEKDFYRTDVVLDGKKIHDVGIRLKGNLSLYEAMGKDVKNIDSSGCYEKIFFQLPDNWPIFSPEEKQNFLKKNGLIREPTLNIPLLIKIDAFIPERSYQGFTEIAVRSGNEKSLLAEPLAFFIHKQSGNVAPETAYASIEISGQKKSLYVICENPGERYIEKYFPLRDGTLYKSGNFINFDYKDDNPLSYFDDFELVTNKNKDDLAPLIRFIKFIKKSNEKEFEDNLDEWLDIESFTRIMVIDNLLLNEDSFAGFGSNFYFFYDKQEKKFFLLPWDMNMVMQQEKGLYQIKTLHGMAFQNTDQERKIPFSDTCHKNILRDRFFANKHFRKMYLSERKKIEEAVFNQAWSLEKIESLSEVFKNYNTKNNIVEPSEYDLAKSKFEIFFKNKK